MGGQRVQEPLDKCTLALGPCELPAVLYLSWAALQGGQKAEVGQEDVKQGGEGWALI